MTTDKLAEIERKIQENAEEKARLLKENEKAEAELLKAKEALIEEDKKSTFKSAVETLGEYDISEFVQYLIKEKLYSTEIKNPTNKTKRKVIRKVTLPLAAFIRTADFKDGSTNIDKVVYDKNHQTIEGCELVSIAHSRKVKKSDWGHISNQDIHDRKVTHALIENGELKAVWNKYCGQQPNWVCDNTELPFQYKKKNGEEVKAEVTLVTMRYSTEDKKERSLLLD